VCKSLDHVSLITLLANCEVFTSNLDLYKNTLLGVLRLDHLMQACDEEKLLGHLGVVLYEYLGEEYPEVLGSILGALKAIVNVIGMTKMTPPIKDLLPRLTPILKNRHEKVCMLGGAELHRKQLQQLCFYTVAYCPALPRTACNGQAAMHSMSVLKHCTSACSMYDFMTSQQLLICGLFCHSVHEADFCGVAGARELH